MTKTDEQVLKTADGMVARYYEFLKDHEVPDNAFKFLMHEAMQSRILLMRIANLLERFNQEMGQPHDDVG